MQGISHTVRGQLCISRKRCWAFIVVVALFPIKSSLISQLFNRFLPNLQREKINLSLVSANEVKLREQLKS